MLALLGLCLGETGGRALAQDDPYAGRPGLAGPEMTPPEIATCAGLERTLAGFEPPRTRVDLWASGALSMVQTDQVLWYLVICEEPGIRVMCVTYSDNGMKLGDRVVVAGAMERQDETHVVLDPCLAARE